MHHLTSIVAVNEDGAIGIGNALPWRVKSDLRFFREQTEGNIVIMGRKTYDSLNGGLKNRHNIVVTHGFNMIAESAFCRAAMGIEEALDTAQRIKKSRQEVFVIGGASMYEQFAQYVDRYLVTEIKKAAPGADTFLPRCVTDDIAGWQRSIIQQGRANEVGDEADFTIWEFLHPDSGEVARHRAAVLASIQKRRDANRLAYVPPLQNAMSA